MSDVFLLSEQEFAHQYSSLLGTQYVDIGASSKCPTTEAAYALYLHYAINGEGFQLFGRIKNNNNITTGFDEGVYQNFEAGGYAFNPTKSMNADIVNDPGFIVGKSGEKILEYLKRWGWTPALNDIWVLANVHARKDFIPISPLNASYVFDKDFGVSVFGRELVGITLAGYIKKTVFEQETFVAPHNDSRPGVDKLSLQNYAGKMKALSVAGTSGEKITAFQSYFRSAGLTIGS